MSDQTAVEHDAHASDAAHEKTSDLLIAIGREASSETITVGELKDALADRAFGVLLLIFALPCCIPILYGIPQAMSLPLLFFAVQIAIGRHQPWLPRRLRERSFSAEGFRQMAEKAGPYLRWFESVSRPRFTWLTSGGAERVLGVFLIAFSASIAVPLPLTNTVPGIGIAIMALGFIERDGFLILVGTIIGAIWVAALVTAIAWLLLTVGSLEPGALRDLFSQFIQGVRDFFG